MQRWLGGSVGPGLRVNDGRAGSEDGGVAGEAGPHRSVQPPVPTRPLSLVLVALLALVVGSLCFYQYVV